MRLLLVSEENDERSLISKAHSEIKVCNSPGKACGIDINAVNYVCLLFVCLDVQSSRKERIRTSISLRNMVMLT